jgi:Na+-transporting methylmalonyl-CoA/oxaloacetate decarboxylase gamma subunit
MFSMTFSLLVLIIVAVACIGLGAAGYRYLLKRNPAKIEAWAAAIKEARERLQAKLQG